ncbi:hypothetical protein ACFO3J_25575 [Streptomyces polygonati]|uniref:Hydrophobic W protein n=1 Tax=Streptomyces polygonati TaxID=1617087 RepID=A0ABV8HV77_9ACTN
MTTSASASASGAAAAGTATGPGPGEVVADRSGPPPVPPVPAGAVVATGGEGGVPAVAAAAADGGEGPQGPRGGPSKRVLLVAAGAVGVILIGIPFLVTGRSDGQDTAANTASAHTVDTTPAPEPDPQSNLVGVGKGLDSPSAEPSKHAAKAGHSEPARKSPPLSASRRPATPAAPAGAASHPKKSASPAASGSRKSAQSGTTTPTKAPAPPGPVAVAVKKLAASSPGRHICYRAYVVGIGWQSPVCDGAMAGTTGQARAIEAIDIAVSGVSGVASSGLMQTTGWQKWSTPNWPSAPDATDLVVGVPGGAGVMQGYGISVGSGVVCQTAHVQNEGWHSQGCDTGDPGSYIFGGTLNGANWLEAVKFTV